MVKARPINRRLFACTILAIGLLTIGLNVGLMIARHQRPRSEWLAFTNYSDADLYLVKTDGTLRRVTTAIVYYPIDPVWGRTRRSLLYTTSGVVNQVSLQYGQIQPLLAEIGAAFYHPTPSRNGHWVYYMKATANAGTDVWRRSATGRTQQLTFFYTRQAVVEDYALSPDEQWLAVWLLDTQQIGTGRTLLVLPVGGNATPIITNALAVNSVAWSPDSAWLVVAYQAQDGPQIVRVRRDGKQSSVLYHYTQPDTSIAAAWSPDGRWVAYNAPCQPDLAFVGCLWLVATDDWQPHPIYNFGNGQAIYRGYVGPPRWSPDSRTLAFAQPDTQNRGLRSLYQIQLDGNSPTRLALPILGDEFAWSPIIDFGHLNGGSLVVGLGFMMIGGYGLYYVNRFGKGL